MKKTIAAGLFATTVLAGATAVAVQWQTFDIRRAESSIGNIRDANASHQALGLTAFSFHYGNGDHKFRQLALMPGKAGFVAGIEDNDGHDMFDVRAQYVKLPLAGPFQKRLVTSATCNRVCRLKVTLPKPSAGVRLVLQGFRFTRSTGDMNLVGLSVQYVGGIIKVGLSGDDDKPFRAEVAYTWVPDTFLDGGEHVAHAIRHVNVDHFEFMPQPSGKKLLSGFGVGFNGHGAHHIRDIAVSLPEGGQPTVVYNDNNFDDQADATVWYYLVK